MAAKRNIPEAWKNQWSKFMFNFFDYLPTKYEANKRERFFKGKKCLVFDDILTQGHSYARFACALETLGAEVLGGYFLGKTILL